MVGREVSQHRRNIIDKSLFLSGRVMWCSDISISDDTLGNPVDALNHPVPCQARRGEGHHLPGSYQLEVGLEQRLDLAHSHAIHKVLLVGRNQEGNTSHILILDHCVEGLFGLFDSFSVAGINHIDNSVALLQNMFVGSVNKV